MKIRINTPKILVNALFFLIALLFSAIGLRVGFDESSVKIVFQIGVMAGLFSLAFFSLGIVVSFISKKKKGNPTKIRKRFTDSFNFAEEHPNVFIKRLQLKNLIFAFYYCLVCVVSSLFFICVSLCFFVKPVTALMFPVVFVAVAPTRKALEYLLKKDNANFGDGGIKKEEFSTVYDLFDSVVKSELGSSYKTNLDFGSLNSVTASRIAKTVSVKLNSYAFLLFNDEELKALSVREIRALKNNDCKVVAKLLQSRKFYLSISQLNIMINGYFSFILSDSITNFDFAKNALKRILEKRKDDIIKSSDFAKTYLTAYKKQCVMDAFFGDARSFITLNLNKDQSLLREFVQSVYNMFLELVPAYGNEWELGVETKLKAMVCDKLTYREKSKNLGESVKCGEFLDNCTEEQKTLYDKYNTEYYEATKRAHEPKNRAIDGYFREVERYEQYPDEYDERLKLISVAHAYYMTAQLDKAEKIYNDILVGGDSTAEFYFDYGCFLLLVKKDTKGIDYIYKAMENENLVEEGFEVLGKYFISSGDENGYKDFCEYKAKKLDEIVNGFDGKMLDTKAEFETTSLEESVLEEITQKLIKDDNLEEIYCADSKTKTGEKIIVFAVSVRNKTNDAFLETYERVFSILDNDYGKYDTFLISLDAEQNKKLVEKIKKDKKFCVFKR